MRLREIINLIETSSITESIENRDRTFYHVTLVANLPTIMERGLLPSIGDRSKKLGEGSCVFLFPDQESAEDAVGSWLGDQFDEDEPLALLEVVLPPEIEIHQTEGVDWEIYTKSIIPPECLTILSRDF